jgi:iron complex transport system substrate-binding protein
MMDDSDQPRSPTRRDYVKYGGLLVGGGLLSGCTSDGGTELTTTPTKTEGTTESPTETEHEPTATNSSYSVTMEPVGTVEFNNVPETWFPYTADYADMGVALGRADGLQAIGVSARFGTHLYEELPNVFVDKDGLTQLWQDGTGKEIFYELDADVHVIDPNFMVHRLGWSQDDVDEINENVAPFFGNTGFTQVYDWHDYQYYSMYEAFEKLADVFQEHERYEAFKTYHDDVLADVQSRLPERTTDIALLYPAGIPPESFYPYLVGDGTASKHWNDLQVDDAPAQHDTTDAQVDGGTIDVETLLEIDPDAIAIRLQGEITQEYFEDEILSHLREHDVASRLHAVQNNHVIYGGLTYQGPIIHLFQLEQAAQGLFPDEFGDNRVFDRQHVADIINGDLEL